MKSSDNNNKLKISAATWNNTFELPDGSYPISDIQNSFEYFIKKHGIITDNPLIIIYVNKIKNRTTFKIKTRDYLAILTPGTIKLLGRTENKTINDKNVENIPHLEIIVVLVHCNIVNKDCLQDS